MFDGVRACDTAGESIDIGSAKCRAVFAVLALSAGKTVTVDRLVECVWGNEPPQKAEKTLQSYVSLLRSALDPHGVTIRRVGTAYVLELDPAAVDVLRFEREIDCGNAEGALGEWTGLPLAGLDAPGLEPVIAGLLERWQSATHADLTKQIDEGRSHDTIGRLTELTAEHPFQEDWWELLMTALYRVGRQADALAAYADARRHLVDELGVEPGPRLRELEADILRQDSAVEPFRRTHRPEPVEAESAPSSYVGPRRTNLPAARSGLIGREVALGEIRRTLADHRLVTITAGGGTGKTRLALAIGEAELSNHADGVWFADLTAVTAGDHVPTAIAGAVGLVLTRGDVTGQVIDYLSDHDALVIIDNCEHLIVHCAEFAGQLLARSGRTKLLATSRELLDIDGEHTVRLPPLAVDDGASAATKLFIERARAVDSTFDPSASERAAIVELCRRLDGLPLAIELAAARSNVMTAAELLAGIGDRFELLTTGRRRRSGPTLEETLDWSYALLDPQEQEMFRSLGVFSGTFDLDAVASVSQHDWPTAIALLESLIAKSLVVREQSDGPSRFRLLETTGAYAAEHLHRLNETERARDRHLDHYVSVCIPLVVGFLTNGAGHGLISDVANVRAALHWAVARGRWHDAGAILFGSAAAMRSNAEEVRSMVDACLPFVERTDIDLAFRLRYVRWDVCLQLDDWPSVMASVSDFEASDDALCCALGGLARGWTQMIPSPSTSLATLASAMGLAETLPDSVERDQIRGALHVLQGWAETALDRHEQALVHFEAARPLLSASSSVPDLLTLCLQSTIVTHVIVGDAPSALEMIPFLDGHHHVYLSDECRVVVDIALGDVEHALPLIRRHAADGATGKLSRKANDSLLLLALLAQAEGDEGTAKHLLLEAGDCRSPATIALSLYLADQLNVRAAFDAARLAASNEPYESGQRALQHLRAEIENRELAT